MKSRYTTACVTGASSGLGRAIAQALRREGLQVWGTSRRPDALTLSAEQGAQHWLALDLADPESLDAFLQRLQQDDLSFDIFVNNAGFGATYPFEQFPPASIERQLTVLLTAPAQLCRAVYPRMLRRGSGCLVNVSSLAAEFPLPFLSLYNASKAGLSALSRSLDLECPTPDLRILDFRPGDFRTNFADATEMPVDENAPARADFRSSCRRQRAMMASAPTPERAAADLVRALERGRRGTVRSGQFFQARLGPFLARGATWPLLRTILRRYLGMRG